MTHFTGAHAGRLDTKGRILVPKPFRDLLQSLVPPGAPSLRLRPSDKEPCLEAWPIPEFNAYSARTLEKLADDEAAVDDFNVIFHWTALEIEPDGDGRLKLPANFTAHAGLAGDVMFLGTGKIFQIWSKEAAVQRLAQAAAHRGTKAPPLVATGEA
jgi:MraZ protein